MDKKYLIGKKVYTIADRSYEGDIREKGVEAKLSYAGTIKEIKDGWITFNENKHRVSIDNLKKEYIFVDLEEILSKDKKWRTKN